MSKRYVLAVPFLGVILLGTSLIMTATPPNEAPSAVAALPTSSNTFTPEPAATASPISSPSPSPTAISTPTPEPIGARWRARKPNELGRIMILEYHKLGPEEDRWTRSYANFWRDMGNLYAKGYRPVGLNDLLDNTIDVPAGFSPVVLTFDDSSPQQFTYLHEPGGDVGVDPNSAVGMLERFHQLHPDFPLKATFFVLPGADPPHDLFGQEEFKERKLRHLVDKGFEIGNHTFWHQRLDQLEEKEDVSAQIGKAIQSLETIVPGYQVRTLALPLGLFPADEGWARAGNYEGATYKNEMILLATGGTTPPPDHKEFDPLHVPRIQATNEELDFEEVYIGYYDQHPEDRYVSDGDPDMLVFPIALKDVYQPKPSHSEVTLEPSLAAEYRAVRLR